MSERKEIINGKEFPIMSWKEVVEKYAGKTVFHMHIVHTGGDGIYDCTVIEACEPKDTSATFERLIKEGFMVTFGYADWSDVL